MHDAYQQDLLVPGLILVQPMSRSVEDVLSTSSSMLVCRHGTALRKLGGAGQPKVGRRFPSRCRFDALGAQRSP
jgi:hypothetical protein